MKKIFLIILLIIGLPVLAEPLRAGISMVEALPGSFYGCWRVFAKIDQQSGTTNFRPKTVDFWNLSRNGNVINLNNPFTGADASVTIDYVDGNIIRFTKTGEYDNKKLTDTVDLKLTGDTFTGINSIKLETFSTYDNSLVKTDTALYILEGEKISGSNISGEE